MLKLLRRIFLISTFRQWKGWTLPSRQTTAGYLTGLASLAIAIYALIPSPGNDRQAAQAIETNIALRTAEIRAIAEIEESFMPKGPFTSKDLVLAELERFNTYGRKTSSTLNLADVYRLFKQYGTHDQQKEFAERINAVHTAALRVTDFLVDLANSSGPRTAVEAQTLFSTYIQLVNQTKSEEARLHGFIEGITPKYFGY